MATIATALLVLVAAIHVYIVVLEMFLWRTPRGLKAFGTDQAFADASAPLAANQGLYNGFLVAGLIWGLVAERPDRLPGHGSSSWPASSWPACTGPRPSAGGSSSSRRCRRPWPWRRCSWRDRAERPDRAWRSVARRLSGPSQPVLRSGGHARRDARLSEGARHDPTAHPSASRIPAIDPDDDDRLIGRVLTRREVLALMGAASVGVVAAACAPASVASGAASAGSSATGSGRDGGPGRIRGGRRELPAVLRRRARADRGPVLRQREPRPIGHPDRHVGRLDQRGRGPDASTGSCRRSTATRASRSRACWSTSGIATPRATIRTSAASRGTTTCAATSTPTRPARPGS